MDDHPYACHAEGMLWHEDDLVLQPHLTSDQSVARDDTMMGRVSETKSSVT